MVSFPTTLDPALLFPLAVLTAPLFYFSYRAYSKAEAAKEVARTGIGRGAPGFKTGVQRVALPASIVARIRMGDEVTAEEITEAIEVERIRREAEEAAERERLEKEARGIKKMKVGENVDESWLPAGTLDVGGSKSRRRKK